MLLPQGNWQCGDGQHMECEVLRDSGWTVEDSSGHSDTEQRDGAVKSQNRQLRNKSQ